jgi:gluconate 2-dehydrogenase gamma chain
MMKKKRIPEVQERGTDGAPRDSLTRREMIANSALTGGALAGLATVGASLIPVSAIQAAQATTAAKAAPAFAPEQRRILEAFIDRIIPRDENGPGALDAGAADYIDRAFVEFLGSEKDSFTAGIAAVDAFARSSEGASLADLSPEKRDAVLAAIDSGGAANLKAFFNRAHRLTLEGMFCDPHWGGNKNFVGWDLIKYPGVRLMVTADDQKMSAPAKPVHKGAYDSEPNHTEQSHGH